MRTIQQVPYTSPISPSPPPRTNKDFAGLLRPTLRSAPHPIDLRQNTGLDPPSGRRARGSH
eukprot:13135383-Alexandrium_andersonii.AAC.1